MTTPTEWSATTMVADIAARTRRAAADNGPRFAAVLAKYSALWNPATSPAERRALLPEAWEEDGYYVDPMTDPVGPEELADHIEGKVFPALPGHTLRQRGDVSLHGTYMAFNWEYLDADGTVSEFPGASGFDIATLGPTGRLQSVIGFFDATVEVKSAQ